MLNSELLEKLRSLDEVLLLELLNLNSSDLVDAFFDRIIERLNIIVDSLEEEDF